MQKSYLEKSRLIVLESIIKSGILSSDFSRNQTFFLKAVSTQAVQIIPCIDRKSTSCNTFWR